MERKKMNHLVFSGLMIAVVFVLTRFTTITFAFGYFNVGDIAILLCAYLLGGPSAFVAGAIGSALADLSAGYILFSPVTFIVKGLEGFLFAILLKKAKTKSKQVAALVVGFLMMVVGYFIAEAFILGFFDPYFGISAAVSDLLNNIIQASISGVIGFILINMKNIKQLKNRVG